MLASMRHRVATALGALLTVAVVSAGAQTQNALPKYGSGGTLADSSVTDVSGKVGVGTTTPVHTLDVLTAPNTVGFRVRDQFNIFTVLGSGGSDYGVIGWGANGTTKPLRFQTFASLNANSGTDVMTILGNGNVGIGTTVPGHRLDVSMTPNTVGLRVIDQYNIFTVFGTGGSDYGVIGWGANGTTKPLRFQAFSTLNANSGSDVLTLLGNGNVGVGTVTPAAKLHVAGNVVVDGNIGARYQDVAEWVDADTALPAGTVVSADSTGPNRVRSSASAYETAVAGVVSGQPGILLGEAADGKVAVAQSGRVRVRVDASYGAIAPGDLLVTSPRPGFAMRSEPVSIGGISLHRPGTILGKALEALPSGTGEVLVLLTLQ